MSENRATVRSICEVFLSLEQTHQLFSWRVKGVYVWPLMRMPLYYAITKQLGVFGAPHGSSHWKGRRLSRIWLWLWASLSFLIKRKRPTEVLIFDHPRKVIKGKYSVDIYTESLIEYLCSQHVNLEVYENLSYQNLQRLERDYPRRYYDLIATSAKMGAKLTKVKLNTQDHSLISHIEGVFKNKLGIHISLKQLVQRVTGEFQIRRWMYLRILRVHRPKLLVVVVSYSHSIAPLIDAARSLGIPSIEMQHGTYSRYHLGYHFPKDINHPYFCNSFFSFGSFWLNMAQLPIHESEFKIFGFRHMSEQLKVTQKPLSDRDEVLFLSQGVIGEGLSQYALACAYAHLPWKLIYKLHPSEYQTWRNDYPKLSQAEQLGLIQVIDHAQFSLYELMGRARFQVGVFSTAVYEGLALGCITLLVDLPGLEYMQTLIDQDVAEYIQSHEQLIHRLHEHTLESQEMKSKISLEVFSPVHEESLQWLMKMIRT